MTADPQEQLAMVSADVKLSSADFELRAKLTVPAGPTQLIQLLPLIRSLSDHVVNATAQTLEEQGRKISCKKGCGACCRQLVLISEVEARRIDELVQELPEPQRTLVRARFAEARRRLEEAGLLDQLSRAEEWTDQLYQGLATDYFQLRIPCPFLEDESCSIHPDRPITCREYLVTSPAPNCAQPSPETIERVRLPLKVFNALARMEVPESTHFLERYVPLILAP